jgi:hypothetical protein
MSIRLPKAPLIISALLALIAAGIYFLAPLLLPGFDVLGIGSDLIGIGIFGVAFLSFALSFAMATPVQKGAKSPKQVKNDKVSEGAVIMGDFSPQVDSGEDNLSKKEQRLSAKATKTANILAKKTMKKEALDAKKQIKTDALEEKQSLKDEAASRKKAIRDSKEADRKRKYEDDDDSPVVEYVGGEEFTPLLTKEQIEEIKEDERTTKQKKKDEADFARGAKKQAVVAAKLKAIEDKTRMKEEALAEKEKAKLDKKEAKRKPSKDVVVEVAEHEEEILDESAIAETPVVIDELQDAVTEEIEQKEDKYAEFGAPQLNIPSDEDIYTNKLFVIPFSSPITSREGMALQEEMFKRIEELNDKIVSLESELELNKKVSH